MRACVIFDLDDTLIDTRGVLLPDALRRVSEVTGLEVSRLNAAGKTLDELLDGVGELEPERKRAAARAWYGPEIPPIEPLPGARELLAALRGHARLFLLTRGAPARQRAKIRRSGLRPYFEETVIRPIEGEGTKRDDIEAILALCALPPRRCAVVGDDRNDELAYAEELGCLAIEVPATPLSEVASVLERAGLVFP